MKKEVFKEKAIESYLEIIIMIISIFAFSYIVYQPVKDYDKLKAEKAKELGVSLEEIENKEKTGILIEQLLSRRKGKLSNRIAQTTPIAPIPTVQQPIQPTTPTVQQPVQRLGEIPLPEVVVLWKGIPRRGCAASRNDRHMQRPSLE